MAHSHNSSDDVTIVTTRRVACDGGGALGHPKTYLDMGTDTSVSCKYCDRIFRLDENAANNGH